MVVCVRHNKSTTDLGHLHVCQTIAEQQSEEPGEEKRESNPQPAEGGSEAAGGSTASGENQFVAAQTSGAR